MMLFISMDRNTYGLICLVDGEQDVMLSVQSIHRRRANPMFKPLEEFGNKCEDLDP